MFTDITVELYTGIHICYGSLQRPVQAQAKPNLSMELEDIVKSHHLVERIWAFDNFWDKELTFFMM